MTTLTLLTKISNNCQLKRIEKAIALAFEGLEVEAKILGTVADGWVQIALTGEDERIATNYVTQEIALCPSNFGNIKKDSTFNGYISDFGTNESLYIDVGVFLPKIVHATISLRCLQAQLVDGRKIPLGKIAELFGFCRNSPLSVKVSRLNTEKNLIEAELSTGQIERYQIWRESLLDRLLVLGVSLYEINVTLRNAKLTRDVIDVEPLGLLEHALTCKLGTDAAGLIPKIGRILKSANFSVFNAKKVKNLF